MHKTERKHLFLKYIVLLACCLMLVLPIAAAAKSKEKQAPGRAMAQQATKSKKLWRTTDHSKHEVLQKDFVSGGELTQACISCHSEAEKQFHKTIHWTWLADHPIKSANTVRPVILLTIFAYPPTNQMTRAACPVTRAGAIQGKLKSTVWSVTARRI